MTAAPRASGPRRGVGRPSRAVALTVVLAACGGGGSGGSTPSPASDGSAEACLPVEGALPRGATLAEAAGSYRLVLVGAGDAFAAGELELERRPSGLQRRGAVATPLSGTARIYLQAAGAQAVRDIGSTDPAAPGVLVLEDPDADPSVLVRFGSESNAEHRSAVDGAFMVLEPRAITDAGFFGTWRSGVGMERAEGHFCAISD